MDDKEYQDRMKVIKSMTIEQLRDFAVRQSSLVVSIYDSLYQTNGKGRN